MFLIIIPIVLIIAFVWLLIKLKVLWWLFLIGIGLMLWWFFAILL
ncbi:hypothetical protein [Christensenella intestinihominis]|nr:hypothetical protein [Christensenella intestinihominis]